MSLGREVKVKVIMPRKRNGIVYLRICVYRIKFWFIPNKYSIYIMISCSEIIVKIHHLEGGRNKTKDKIKVLVRKETVK